jgi:DNA-binding Xre family transcriptional regulator
MPPEPSLPTSVHSGERHDPYLRPRWSVNMHAIERQRILHGWTRRELARAAHVDEKTVRSMMDGRRRPTFGTLQAVCGALGVMLSDAIMFVEDGGGVS